MAFKKADVRPNSVLLIEANDTHGEVMPGFIKYLLDLGYNIDVLINEEVEKEKPFARMNIEKVRMFCIYYMMLPLFVRLEKVKSYKHIIIMTTNYYYYKIPKAKKGEVSSCSVISKLQALQENASVIIVEHDLNGVMHFKEEDFIKRDKLVTLGRFDRGIFVNPHYFGDIRIMPKNRKTRFVTIGAIQPHRKNHKLLLQAVEDISRRTLDFEVSVIGNGALQKIPSETRRFIDIKGRLNFPLMFEELENSDFFLPLLDPDNKDHDRYITTGVTGSVQLIYGFRKPCLIHEKFASFYGFNEQNSIIYTDSLFYAMERAIAMSAEEYARMQKSLDDLALRVEEESIRNLKRILG